MQDIERNMKQMGWQTLYRKNVCSSWEGGEVKLSPPRMTGGGGKYPHKKESIELVIGGLFWIPCILSSRFWTNHTCAQSVAFCVV